MEGYMQDEDKTIERYIEYSVKQRFDSKMRCLKPHELRVFKPYIENQKNLNEVAEEINADYFAVAQRCSRIKKKLRSSIEAEFKKGDYKYAKKKKRCAGNKRCSGES
jgi:hypothetical protein